MEHTALCICIQDYAYEYFLVFKFVNSFSLELLAYFCYQEIRSKIKFLIDWLEDLSEEVCNCLVTVPSMLSEVERQQQQNWQNIVATEEDGCVGHPRLEIMAGQQGCHYGYDLNL